MAFTKLIIGNIIELDNEIIISCSFRDIETKENSILNSYNFVAEWTNKKLRINNTFEVFIKDVNVTSNIIGFKSIHFLIDNTNMVIKDNDLVEVL